MTDFEKRLNWAISGGLKHCINAHGPITKNFIPSASKRISGQIMGQFGKTFVQNAMQKTIDEKHFVVVDRKEYERVIEAHQTKSKVVRDLVDKLKKHGLLWYYKGVTYEKTHNNGNR